MEPLSLINDLEKSKKTCVVCFETFQQGELVKHFMCGDAMHYYCYRENAQKEENQLNLEECPMEHPFSSKGWVTIRPPKNVPRHHRLPNPRRRPMKSFTDPRCWVPFWLPAPILPSNRCGRCFKMHCQPDLSDMVIHALCGQIYNGDHWMGRCVKCNLDVTEAQCLFKNRAPNA
ncbi:hypothetical protein BVRB_7g157080 [Beta vulgaris subsp. vulgaris]|nr:hypothetical protein BVRB_7g157080 [Beta vulgaris subsp. vulgaris]